MASHTWILPIRESECVGGFAPTLTLRGRARYTAVWASKHGAGRIEGWNDRHGGTVESDLAAGAPGSRGRLGMFALGGGERRRRRVFRAVGLQCPPSCRELYARRAAEAHRFPARPQRPRLRGLQYADLLGRAAASR